MAIPEDESLKITIDNNYFEEKSDSSDNKSPPKKTNSDVDLVYSSDDEADNIDRSSDVDFCFGDFDVVDEVSNDEEENAPTADLRREHSGEIPDTDVPSDQRIVEFDNESVTSNQYETEISKNIENKSEDAISANDGSVNAPNQSVLSEYDQISDASLMDLDEISNTDLNDFEQISDDELGELEDVPVVDSADESESIYQASDGAPCDVDILGNKSFDETCEDVQNIENELCSDYDDKDELASFGNSEHLNDVDIKHRSDEDEMDVSVQDDETSDNEIEKQPSIPDENEKSSETYDNVVDEFDASSDENSVNSFIGKVSNIDEASAVEDIEKEESYLDYISDEEEITNNMNDNSRVISDKLDVAEQAPDVLTDNQEEFVEHEQSFNREIPSVNWTETLNYSVTDNSPNTLNENMIGDSTKTLNENTMGVSTKTPNENVIGISPETFSENLISNLSKTWNENVISNLTETLNNNISETAKETTNEFNENTDEMDNEKFSVIDELDKTFEEISDSENSTKEKLEVVSDFLEVTDESDVTVDMLEGEEEVTDIASKTTDSIKKNYSNELAEIQSGYIEKGDDVQNLNNDENADTVSNSSECINKITVEEQCEHVQDGESESNLKGFTEISDTFENSDVLDVIDQLNEDGGVNLIEKGNDAGDLDTSDEENDALDESCDEIENVIHEDQDDESCDEIENVIHEDQDDLQVSHSQSHQMVGEKSDEYHAVDELNEDTDRHEKSNEHEGTCATQGENNQLLDSCDGIKGVISGDHVGHNKSKNKELIELSDSVTEQLNNLNHMEQLNRSDETDSGQKLCAMQEENIELFDSPKKAGSLQRDGFLGQTVNNEENVTEIKAACGEDVDGNNSDSQVLSDINLEQDVKLAISSVFIENTFLEEPVTKMSDELTIFDQFSNDKGKENSDDIHVMCDIGKSQVKKLATSSASFEIDSIAKISNELSIIEQFHEGSDNSDDIQDNEQDGQSASHSPFNENVSLKDPITKISNELSVIDQFNTVDGGDDSAIQVLSDIDEEQDEKSAIRSFFNENASLKDPIAKISNELSIINQVNEIDGGDNQAIQISSDIDEEEDGKSALRLFFNENAHLTDPIAKTSNKLNVIDQFNTDEHVDDNDSDDIQILSDTNEEIDKISDSCIVVEVGKDNKNNYNAEKTDEIAANLDESGEQEDTDNCDVVVISEDNSDEEKEEKLDTCSTVNENTALDREETDGNNIAAITEDTEAICGNNNINLEMKFNVSCEELGSEKEIEVSMQKGSSEELGSKKEIEGFMQKGSSEELLSEKEIEGSMQKGSSEEFWSEKEIEGSMQKGSREELGSEKEIEGSMQKGYIGIHKMNADRTFLHGSPETESGVFKCDKPNTTKAAEKNENHGNPAGLEQKSSIQESNAPKSTEFDKDSIKIEDRFEVSKSKSTAKTLSSDEVCQQPNQGSIDKVSVNDVATPSSEGDAKNNIAVTDNFLSNKQKSEVLDENKMDHQTSNLSDISDGEGEDIEKPPSTADQLSDISNDEEPSLPQTAAKSTVKSECTASILDDISETSVAELDNISEEDLEKSTKLSDISDFDDISDTSVTEPLPEESLKVTTSTSGIQKAWNKIAPRKIEVTIGRKRSHAMIQDRSKLNTSRISNKPVVITPQTPPVSKRPNITKYQNSARSQPERKIDYYKASSSNKRCEDTASYQNSARSQPERKIDYYKAHSSNKQCENTALVVQNIPPTPSSSQPQTHDVLASFLGTLGMTPEEFEKKCVSQNEQPGQNDIAPSSAARQYHKNDKPNSEAGKNTGYINTTKIWENYFRAKSQQLFEKPQPGRENLSSDKDITATAIEKILQSIGSDLTTSKKILDRLSTLKRTDDAEKDILELGTKHSFLKSGFPQLDVSLEELLKSKISTLDEPTKYDDDYKTKNDQYTKYSGAQDQFRSQSSRGGYQRSPVRGRSRSSSLERRSLQRRSRSRSIDRYYSRRHRSRSNSEDRYEKSYSRRSSSIGRSHPRSRSYERSFEKRYDSSDTHSRYPIDRYSSQRYRSRSPLDDSNSRTQSRKRLAAGRYYSRSRSKDRYRSRSNSLDTVSMKSFSSRSDSFSDNENSFRGSKKRKASKSNISRQSIKRRHKRYSSDSSFSNPYSPKKDIERNSIEDDSWDATTYRVEESDEHKKRPQNKSLNPQTSWVPPNTNYQHLSQGKSTPIFTSPTYSFPGAHGINSGYNSTPTYLNRPITVPYQFPLPPFFPLPPLNIPPPGYPVSSSSIQVSSAHAYKTSTNLPQVSSVSSTPGMTSVKQISNKKFSTKSNLVSLPLTSEISPSLPRQIAEKLPNEPTVLKQTKDKSRYKVVIIGGNILQHIKEQIDNPIENGMKNNFDLIDTDVRIITSNECPKTITELETGQLTTYFGHFPDIVVIMMGEDDFDRKQFAFERFYNTLMRLIFTLQKDFHVSCVIMCELLPIPTPVQVAAEIINTHIDGANRKLMTRLVDHQNKVYFWKHSFLGLIHPQNITSLTSPENIYKFYSSIKSSLVRNMRRLRLDTPFKDQLRKETVCSSVSNVGHLQDSSFDGMEKQSFKKRKLETDFSSNEKCSQRNVLVLGEGLIKDLMTAIQSSSGCSLLENFGFANVNVTVLGKNKLPQTMKELSCYSFQTLRMYAPQVILLMMGEKDLDDSAYFHEVFLMNIQEVISKLEKTFSNSIIAVCEIQCKSNPSVITWPQLTVRAKRINSMIRKEVSEKPKLFFWNLDFPLDLTVKERVRLLYSHIQMVLDRALDTFDKVIKLQNEKSFEKNSTWKIVFLGSSLINYLQNGMNRYKYPETKLTQNFDIPNLSVKMYGEEECPSTVKELNAISLDKYFHELPDIVVIMLGENDVNAACNNLHTLLQNMRDLIYKIKSFGINCVLLVEVLPLRAFHTMNFTFQREAIRKVLKSFNSPDFQGLLYHELNVSKNEIAQLEHLNNITTLYKSLQEGLLKAIDMYTSLNRPGTATQQTIISPDTIIVGKDLVNFLEVKMKAGMLRKDFSVGLNVKMAGKTVCPDTIGELSSNNFFDKVFNIRTDIVMILLGESEVDRKQFKVQTYIESIHQLTSKLLQELKVQFIVLFDVLSFVTPEYISPDVFALRTSLLQSRLQKEFLYDSNVIFLSCKNESEDFLSPAANINFLYSSIAAALKHAREKVNENQPTKHLQDQDKLVQQCEKEPTSISTELSKKLCSLYPSSVETKKVAIFCGQLGNYLKVAQSFFLSALNLELEIYDNKNGPSSIRELVTSGITCFLKNSPDVVLVLLGEEDLDSPDFSYKSFEINVRQLISQIMNFGASVIVLCEILCKKQMNFISESGFKMRQRNVNEQIREHFSHHRSVVVNYFPQKIDYIERVGSVLDDFYKNILESLKEAEGKSATSTSGKSGNVFFSNTGDALHQPTGRSPLEQNKYFPQATASKTHNYSTNPIYSSSKNEIRKPFNASANNSCDLSHGYTGFSYQQPFAQSLANVENTNSEKQAKVHRSSDVGLMESSQRTMIHPPLPFHSSSINKVNDNCLSTASQNQSFTHGNNSSNANLSHFQNTSQQKSCNVLLIAHIKGFLLEQSILREGSFMERNFGIPDINVEFVGQSRCPSSIKKLANTNLDTLFNHLPYAIVIMLGEQDIDSKTFDVTDFMQDIDRIISKVKALPVNCRIIFCEILPKQCELIPTASFTNKINQLNATLKNQCDCDTICSFFFFPLDFPKLALYYSDISTKLDSLYDAVKQLLEMIKNSFLVKNDKSKAKSQLMVNNTPSNKASSFSHSKPSNVSSLSASHSNIGSKEMTALKGNQKSSKSNSKALKAVLVGHSPAEHLLQSICEGNGRMEENFGIENLQISIVGTNQCPPSIRALSNSSLDWLFSMSPRIVVILLGENDIDSLQYNLLRMKQMFYYVANLITQKAKDCRVVITAILSIKSPKVVTANVYNNRKLEVNTMLSEMCRQNSNWIFWSHEKIIQCNIDELEKTINSNSLYTSMRDALTFAYNSITESNISVPAKVQQASRQTGSSFYQSTDSNTVCYGVLVGACLKHLSELILSSNMTFNIRNTNISVECDSDLCTSVDKLVSEKNIAKLFPNNPKVVILQMGENDIDSTLSVENIVSNFKLLVTRLQYECNIPFVIICSILKKFNPLNIPLLSFVQRMEKTNSLLMNEFSNSQSSCFWSHKGLNEFFCDTKHSDDVVRKLFRNCRGAFMKGFKSVTDMRNVISSSGICNPATVSISSSSYGQASSAMSEEVVPTMQKSLSVNQKPKPPFTVMILVPSLAAKLKCNIGSSLDSRMDRNFSVSDVCVKLISHTDSPRTVKDLLATSLGQLFNSCPDVVLLSLGENDVDDPSCDPEDIVSNIAQVIKKLAKECHSFLVVFCEILSKKFPKSMNQTQYETRRNIVNRMLVSALKDEEKHFFWIHKVSDFYIDSVNIDDLVSFYTSIRGALIKSKTVLQSPDT